MTEFRYLRADEWGRRWAHPPQAEKLADPEVYVHHTAGNDSGDSISRFRAVNESDISRGYAGVGYDILVHRDQSTGVVTIGEGRGPWRSAATLDRNEEGEAVCLIGYFHPGHKLSRQPHPDELEGVARGIVWGIEHGWIARDARILGHRDNPAHPGATGCPGDYLYAQLPTIRQRVQELLTHPDEEDDMTKLYVLWRDQRYANVFLVGPGGAVQVTPEQAKRYRAAGVPDIVERHDEAVKAYAAQAGGVTLVKV